MPLNETFTFEPEREGAGSLPLLSDPVTIASGQVLSRLTLVGRVTATRKVIKSVKTATDGSEKPVGFLAVDVDATGADTDAPVYKFGVFDSGAIVIDASWTLSEVRAAFDRSPIFIRTPLEL